jgi:hypothetical protein
MSCVAKIVEGQLVCICCRGNIHPCPCGSRPTRRQALASPRHEVASIRHEQASFWGRVREGLYRLGFASRPLRE